MTIFPFFLEINIVFQFVENRIILHGENSEIKDEELEISIEMEGEGKGKERKGNKKFYLT